MAYFYVIATILFYMRKLTALTFGLMFLISATYAGGGSLKFQKQIHNFGTILEANGNATYIFRFKNTGKGPIRILQILTSCGCTTSDYTKTAINAGDSGFVKAIFDPKDRPGPFSRNLTVITNGIPETYTLMVEGTVGSPDRELLAAFPYQMGSVRFSKYELQMGEVKEDKIDSAYLSIYNPSSSQLIIRNVLSSYPIHSDVKTKVIPPSGGEDFLFTFNGTLCKEYGPRVDTIRLLTNDDSVSQKMFLVKSTIVQNFDKLTQQQTAAAPVFVVQNTEGTIPELYMGETGVLTFDVENKGKSDLLIKGFYSDCKCMTAKFEKDKLKKGKGKLHISINTKKMHGPIVKKITVYTNDPRNSQQVFTIRSKVVVPGKEPIQN